MNALVRRRARRGAGTAAVLGATALLALVAWAVWTMVEQPTRALEPAELYQEWFEAREAPLGLAVVEAQRLPRGDRVLRFEQSSKTEEAARRVLTEEMKTSKEPFDWSKVEIGASDTPPREVVIVELPLADAAAELEKLFKGGQELAGDWKSIPREGGKRVLDRGKLPWAGFDAPFVQEREFEAGGTFRDVLRVNLSRKNEPRFLIARWSRGFPASKRVVGELLAALTPRS